eukprot:TRINITY_DN7833_c0_g1_i2.p1 TRINITY_DN7833_c0_g1~~TRINITY_DN7833_c0_g1_i2.p1  ORF type:complete len:588 (-),score=85.43 TRINITY_DN7833_c0_g1_i2:1352-3115(-)
MLSRLRRAPFLSAQRRVSFQTIHSRLPAHTVVPEFVQVYLSKGSKFIQDYASVTCKDLISASHLLERRLHLAHHFKDSEHNKDEFHIASSWEPPKNPEISNIMHAFRKDLVDSYTSKPSRPNGNWLDKQAKSCLYANKATIMVVDSDKGLGDVLVERSHIDAELDRLIEADFILVAPEQASQQFASARDWLQGTVSRALEMMTISPKLAGFLLLCLQSDGVGSLRLRLKIHKFPEVGRPIVNFRRHWLRSVSQWLVFALRPLQAKCRFVVTGSHTLNDTLLNGQKFEFTDEHELGTIDAKNLYPSLDIEHVIRVVGMKVKQMHPNDYGNLIVHLMSLVLRNQTLQRNGVHFTAKGLAMGLPPAVIIANVYLNEADLHVQRMVKPCIYWRFVDDAFACHSSISEVQDALNEFSPTIVWETTAKGRRQVPFLDRALTMEADNTLSSKLFRKDLNNYLYVPRSSCHPESCFKGLISGELTRIKRASSRHCDFLQDAEFFAEKLIRRGYNYEEFSTALERATCNEASRRTDEQPIYRMKVLHSSTVDYPQLRCLLSIVNKRLGHAAVHAKVDYVNTVQLNMFRRHYRDNWN